MAIDRKLLNLHLLVEYEEKVAVEIRPNKVRPKGRITEHRSTEMVEVNNWLKMMRSDRTKSYLKKRSKIRKIQKNLNSTL